MSPPGSGRPESDADTALQRALERLMSEIARLCLAHGMAFADAEEMLKRAYVNAARAALHPGSGTRDISRVSTATGLNRREVTRISNEAGAPPAPRRSPATQVFTRWVGSPLLRGEGGEVRSLKRQGPAPSFEALAQSVTRDVHPRSLLDELCRLGLASLDESTDTVRLLRDSFVPGDDQARMLDFLGSNVGDHLATAVTNVLGKEAAQLEQAIFADELSDESLAAVRKLVAEQWKTLLGALVPRLQALIDADRDAGRRAHKRIRIGLYSHQAGMDERSGTDGRGTADNEPKDD